MEEKLNKLYTDPSQPGSFTGQSSFFKALKNKNIKRRAVKDFLAKLESYTLHKPKRKNFLRKRVVVPFINHTFQADLVDVSNIKDENDGYCFILTCIDVFSKKAWALPLKNKSGKIVLEAFRKIVSDTKPLRLQVDKGSEFYNKEFLNYCKSNNIRIYSTNSELKACVVERFNRTLKEKMYRYFTHMDSKKYIDVLDEFLISYNNTYHRSIKRTPNQVNKADEAEIFLNLYKYRKEDGNKEPINLKFEIGNKVRISKIKKTFEKGYLPNFTIEIFIIDKILPSHPPTYIIKDLLGEEIEGTFYETELQKVLEDVEPVYRIEKIIQKKKVKNNTKYLVKWLGYPDKFNSWIEEKDLK